MDGHEHRDLGNAAFGGERVNLGGDSPAGARAYHDGLAAPLAIDPEQTILAVVHDGGASRLRRRAAVGPRRARRQPRG